MYVFRNKHKIHSYNNNILYITILHYNHILLICSQLKLNIKINNFKILLKINNI